MKTWILILYAYGSALSSTPGFVTSESCEIAGAKTIKALGVKYVCVEQPNPPLKRFTCNQCGKYIDAHVDPNAVKLPDGWTYEGTFYGERYRCPLHKAIDR